MIKNGLTIAGSDSGGGAGIQADIKTMSSLGVFATSVVTAITAQNTKEVNDILPIPPSIVESQINTVFSDIEISSVKIGMLGDGELIKTIKKSLTNVKAKNIVLDPVMITKAGVKLIDDENIDTLKNELFPMVDIITPNMHEACEILKCDMPNTIDDVKNMARELHKFGSKYVLVKGGHGNFDDCIDILYDGNDFYEFSLPRINTKNTHGTGCSLSSAIASHMAIGHNIVDAVDLAKKYIYNAILNSDKLNVGKGCGPLMHFYKSWNNDNS